MNPDLPEKGLAVFYNPTSETIVRKIELPLDYTSLTGKARIAKRDGKPRTYPLDREYRVKLKVKVEPGEMNWFVVR